MGFDSEWLPLFLLSFSLTDVFVWMFLRFTDDHHKHYISSLLFRCYYYVLLLKWKPGMSELSWQNPAVFVFLSLSKIRIIFVTASWKSPLLFCQLEDLEVTVSDHIQKVLKPNFAAAWEEVGDDFEKEETFALSSIKTLDGEMISPCLLVTHIVIPVNLPCWGYI